MGRTNVSREARFIHCEAMVLTGNEHLTVAQILYRVISSVMAQAPIFSSVRSSSPQRSFCSIVPFERIAPDVSPTLTPSAVTMPGQ